MSSKTQLNQMKKNDLVNVVLSLQEQIREIGKDDSYKKLSKQLEIVLAENQKLHEELESAKKSEKFVAVELLSQGNVWLPSPESKSGRPEDANKGYLLKKTGQIAIIPAYWMIEYVANRNPSFLMGDVRINNEVGKKLNPNIEFVELDIPEEFYEDSIPLEDIVANVRKGGEDLQRFINRFKDKPFVLARIMNVIDEILGDYSDEDPQKVALIPISENLNRILNPDTSKENK